MNILTTYWNLPAPPLRQWHALMVIFDILVLQVLNSAPNNKKSISTVEGSVVFYVSFNSIGNIATKQKTGTRKKVLSLHEEF